MKYQDEDDDFTGVDRVKNKGYKNSPKGKPKGTKGSGFQHHEERGRSRKPAWGL